MNRELKMSGFARFAWFTLAYNVVVILWGVFLRASRAGDGCGQHWLTCHGEVVPSAPELKTVIEFSHRVTSGIAFIIVLALVIWAFRRFAKGHSARKTAVVSFIFILTEALVGAGLVLTGNTAGNMTAARPFWMAGHLTNTFILLAFLTLTAWRASGGSRLNFKSEPKILLMLTIAILGIFLVGVSGSLAALSSMIFPSETFSEGLAKDFAETSHMILRLRISHPILSVVMAGYLAYLALWFKRKMPENAGVSRWANAILILICLQLVSGAVTVLTLAPIVMQLVHLFLADAVWIAFILLGANALAERRPFSLHQI